jgi:hypothetical protein
VTGLPPQDLACPNPSRCPVPNGLGSLPYRDYVLPTGTTVYRGYDGARGYSADNPGYGDTRFQPFDAKDGTRVPSMYFAETDTAALLETVFHEVHHLASRQIGQSTLLGRLIAYLKVPQNLHLVDLRDPELARLNVARSQIVSTTAEHYPCTRRVAAELYEPFFRMA